MSGKGFTHLHVHSQYSLLDGAIKFEELFARCKELGMDSVAITDHGNLFGAVEFYTKSKDMGVKPIIGIEAYVAPGSRLDKDKSGGIADAAYHLILLAENNKGWQNLIDLSSIGYIDGFYYRPRIDKEVLAKYSEGLICTSACLKGEIAAALARGDEAAAEAVAHSYLAIFGKERFFIEIQEHESLDAPEVRQPLIALARKLGIGLVATNDVHFLSSTDYDAHEVLCCLNMGRLISDESRLRYPKDVYLKSSEEMREMFADVPEACDNTLAIAARCNVKLDLSTRHAPVYRPADGSTPDDFLRKKCYEGAKGRYDKVTPEVEARLERELNVIQEKGFSSYFLIVWDFCNYAMENGIPVGARGSGVGTIVGYCLGLCDVDPLKYGLLFERFMDPERNEMPDIDIDICQDGRGKVIDYVREKYGHVAQIITFGTMKARLVIRDVCRVLSVPLAEADRLAKLVPATLNMTLDEAIRLEPELRKAYEDDPVIKKVLDIGRKLEGLARHAGVHAAGVVVADEPLTKYVPLYKQPNSDDLITQFEGPMVEKMGLLKIDFLGLKTLSILERAKALVEGTHGVKVDLEKLDLHDPKVFAVFGSGRTKGIFQFESGGMQDMLMKLKPDRVEDLIAANALYRPGPMELIPDYIERKHGRKWSVAHPIMRNVLEETFGIMVYQEQVMQICNQLGDIPLRQAYALIKAISKKNADMIAKEKALFIDGAQKKGIKEDAAVGIFELIEKFAGYGFNKSHSSRYALVAYQTAYMKAYWPVEYMAAVLTYAMEKMEEVVDYIAECTAMGIKVNPPDINESFSDFTVVYEKDKQCAQEHGFIRFGLSAVKGVGEKAVEEIVQARHKVGQFASLYQFCETVDMRAVNKQVVESLIKAGAFDRLGGSRSQMLAACERAMQAGASSQADTRNGQMNLFGGGPDETAKDSQHLPDVPPWSETQMLTYEKEVLGFYVTSNPLSNHAAEIRAYSSADTSRLEAFRDREVTVGGMISKIRNSVTKTGRNVGAKMAVIMLQDLQGTVEVVLFPETLEQNSHLVETDKIVFVKGKVDCRREQPNIIASELISLEEASDRIPVRVQIKIAAAELTAEKIQAIKALCGHHRGKSQLQFAVKTHRGTVFAAAGREFNVKPEADFCSRMEHLVGAGCVERMR
jgi:DNA polymerase-3 subunit alpha